MINIWLLNVSEHQRNNMCYCISAILVWKVLYVLCYYIQFGFSKNAYLICNIFMLNMSIFSPLPLYFYFYLDSCSFFLVNTSNAVSGFTVKETSKVGARPEKPIEIYEFERYFILLSIFFFCNFTLTIWIFICLSYSED